jgi:DNA polymerase-3 subunit epsilon
MHVLTSQAHEYPPGAGFAVIDVETTGLSPRTSRIVEIAVLLLDVDGAPVGEIATLVKPDAHIAATDIHGIRARDVRDAPSFSDVAPLLVGGLRGRVPVAHNAPFELRMLAAEFRRLGWELDGDIPGLCTMALAEAYLQRAPGRSLAACCAATGYALVNAHAALADAHACAHLLRTYRSAHSHLPESWHEALLSAALVRWPELDDMAPPRLLTREQAAYTEAVEIPYLARLVATLPRATGVSTITQSYLEALDRALADRLITREEAEGLIDLADALGLGASEVLDIHRSYLGAVASAALADGVVTPTELSDLQEVARLLALTDADLQAALQTAASTPQAHPVGVGELAIGDGVVITGDTLLVPRQKLEQMTRDAGLRLVSSVSRKTKLLVVADPHTQSRKAQKAREVGTRIVGETVYLQMLNRLRDTTSAAAELIPDQPAPPRHLTAVAESADQSEHPFS